MDHMDRLGNTLAEVAANKAGIIKRGAPVVTAPQDPEAMSVVMAKARDEGTLVAAVGADVPYELVSVDLSGTTVEVDAPTLGRIRLHTPLVGRHQAMNCATAVAAIDALAGARGISLPFLRYAAGWRRHAILDGSKSYSSCRTP